MALYVLDIGTLFGLMRKAVRYFAAFYLAEFFLVFPIRKAVTNSAAFCQMCHVGQGSEYHVTEHM